MLSTNQENERASSKLREDIEEAKVSDRRGCINP